MEKKFSLIIDFVNELDKLYGKKLKPLCLYKNLLEKIKPADKNYDKFVEKHVKIIEKWVRENKENIMQKKNTFDPSKILYTNRVFIDMNEIFSLVSQDEESREIMESIYEFLITFSAIFDPTSNAKKILKERAPKKTEEISGKLSSNKEGQFLSNIFGKIENSINPDSSNPMEAVGMLMSSGAIMDLFTGLTNGIQDGSMNIGSLMGELTNLVGGMSSAIDTGEDPIQKEMLKTATDSINKINTMITEEKPEKEEEIDIPKIKELELD
jgi:hypothetical protein